MRLFLTYLPPLACAGAMVLCVRMMRGGGAGAQPPDVHRVVELDEAAPQTQAAGCGPVQTIPAYSGAPDQAHIGTQVASPPPLTRYPSTPPASGPHDPAPQGAGVYPSPPPVYSTIHSLEHGAAV